MAWPLGWLSDRLDRRWVIIGTVAAAAAGLLVMMAIVAARSLRLETLSLHRPVRRDDHTDIQHHHCA